MRYRIALPATKTGQDHHNKPGVRPGTTGNDHCLVQAHRLITTSRERVHRIEPQLRSLPTAGAKGRRGPCNRATQKAKGEQPVAAMKVRNPGLDDSPAGCHRSKDPLGGSTDQEESRHTRLRKSFPPPCFECRRTHSKWPAAHDRLTMRSDITARRNARSSP